MANEVVLAQVILQSPNQKHRYTISVSDGGELMATKLVLKDGAWSEPRPEVARKNLAVPMHAGSENLR
jgi:hypothetical protein